MFKRTKDWLTASIARQFAAATLLVAAITGATLGTVFISQEWLHLRNDVFRHFEDTAHLTGQRIEFVLDGMVSDASELAHNPLIGNALVDSGGRDTYLAPFLRAYKSSGRTPTRISLYDFQGAPIASNLEKLPPSVGAKPWFASTIAGTPTGVIQDGAALAAFPVIFPSTGLPEGVLVAEISLSSMFQHGVNRSTDGMSMLIEDKEGAVLTSIGGNVSEGFLSLSRPLTLGQPLGQLGLSLTIRQDKAKAYAPLNAIWAPFLAVGTAAAAAALALAFFISRRLTGQLTALSEAATAISVDVSANPTIPMHGHDEVAKLGVAVATMLVHIKNSHRTLEARVEARTAELRAAEDNLRAQASRLAAILESVVDGIITITDMGTVLSVNPATERLFGWSADEIVGQNVKMLMPEPLPKRPRRLSAQSS